MRTTLKVKYLPPTTHRGTRLRVEDSRGKRKVYAYAYSYSDFRIEAVRQFLGQGIVVLHVETFGDEDYVTCCI